MALSAVPSAAILSGAGSQRVGGMRVAAADAEEGWGGLMGASGRDVAPPVAASGHGRLRRLVFFTKFRSVAQAHREASRASNSRQTRYLSLLSARAACRTPRPGFLTAESGALCSGLGLCLLGQCQCPLSHWAKEGVVIPSMPCEWGRRS